MIRSAKETDWPSIEHIYNETKLDELQYDDQKFVLLPLKEDESRYNKLLEARVIVFEAGVVVGYLARFENKIRGLYVTRSFRNQGIASQLLRSSLDGDSEAVSLNVAKSNVPAQTLYRKFGFKIEAEFSSIYNGLLTDALEMVRQPHEIEFTRRY